MPKFTAFCQEITGKGTIWIQAIKAADLEHAELVAQAECAEAWDMDPDDIHVLGLAEADVKILSWNDIND